MIPAGGTDDLSRRRKGPELSIGPHATRADAEADLFQYIEVFYNRSRRHSTLGYSSPIRYIQDWISKHAVQQPKAA